MQGLLSAQVVWKRLVGANNTFHKHIIFYYWQWFSSFLVTFMKVTRSFSNSVEIYVTTRFSFHLPPCSYLQTVPCFYHLPVFSIICSRFNFELSLQCWSSIYQQDQIYHFFPPHIANLSDKKTIWFWQSIKFYPILIVFFPNVLPNK